MDASVRQARIAVPPPPGPSDRSANMRANRRRDTSFEISVRSRLHALGARFRVDYPIKTPAMRAFRVDIAFTRQLIAVQCDGCFWHGCPEHGRRRTSRNSHYWGPKIDRNRQRDAEQDHALDLAGWKVFRFWEHEDPTLAAELIAGEVERARERAGEPMECSRPPISPILWRDRVGSRESDQ
jgi:DNA mismatch endonuclease (patch repair protein)